MKTAPPAYILMEYNHNVLVQKQVDVAKFMQRIYDLGYHVYDCQMQVRGCFWRANHDLEQHIKCCVKEHLAQPCLSTMLRCGCVK
eukprot:8348-Chlamydomonas_euryale.AAC.2